MIEKGRASGRRSANLNNQGTPPSLAAVVSNQNTGQPSGLDAEMQVAHPVVYHTAQYPLHLRLPIIPR